MFGGQSQFAAKASLASLKQGKYYAFHDTFLSVDKPLTNKIEIVFQTEKTDLNVDQLKKDMEDHSIQQQLKDKFQLAQALQLVGTPTFVVGNKLLDQFHFIPGGTSQKNIQNAIDQVARPIRRINKSYYLTFIFHLQPQKKEK
nr:DsbA family protein [Coxiella-like endosymbiont]